MLEKKIVSREFNVIQSNRIQLEVGKNYRTNPFNNKNWPAKIRSIWIFSRKEKITFCRTPIDGNFHGPFGDQGVYFNKGKTAFHIENKNIIIERLTINDATKDRTHHGLWKRLFFNRTSNNKFLGIFEIDVKASQEMDFKFPNEGLSIDNDILKINHRVWTKIDNSDKYIFEWEKYLWKK